MTVSPEAGRDDPLGGGFRWRLRAELDRVRPPYSSPRYLAPGRDGTGAMRLATAVFAVAVVGILSLSAYATSGSPNPAEWTKRIVTRIGANESNPPPIASASPSPLAAAPAPPTQRAPSTPRSGPTQRPAGTPSPEHEPGDDHSASGARTASPSPYGGDH